VHPCRKSPNQCALNKIYAPQKQKSFHFGDICKSMIFKGNFLMAEEIMLYALKSSEITNQNGDKL